ncbi:pimeloyl-ACP methyl ester esterase BioH [Shewanella alkalitolerans]|uniref:pimeloyl-ACP methyl ester esterase BioH n=1 Tax=Shewanella alkalitolerans TaxID=2864209 RepID=UPI001C655286|nr:pimeloyl-ACP methyl ester esterase BioH [Shewanella alkalitolerans]QYJ97486.1 pimeloyl-ACP methyl ester esterase BioH [Shewanella alkalitolerans]
MSQQSLHIETIGQGRPIVLLHGWGVNSAVFTPLHHTLKDHQLLLVDLPGFGDSPAIEGDLDAWVDHLMPQMPERAIWAGWSLGGLVATRAALRYPERINALLTIASSPCFMAREDEGWPGIPPQILGQFGDQLEKDLGKMIERFLAIQAMGSETAKQDIKQLRDLVMAKPLPDADALRAGLQMLKEVDLRDQLNEIRVPWLRVWGRLDGLVSRRVQPLMPVCESRFEDLVLPKASHAPFFSHRDAFVQGVEAWLQTLKE